MNQLGLFEYGIQNEKSHIRAHVCPKVRRIYVYPTDCGVSVLDKGIETKGYQPGVKSPTGFGMRIPPFEIPKCVALQVNEKVWDALNFAQTESTTEKGDKAARLVAGMVKAGIFSLPIAAALTTDVSMSVQIQGTDIIVYAKDCRIKIQVKCDFIGGEKQLGGSGYLFLQTAEKNPLFRY